MTVASDESRLEETAIGLKWHTVRVVAYRAEWRRLFERELRDLRKRVGHLAVDIQHVGSTAVPGLDAKPIIDIALAVASPGVIPRLRQPLSDLGYIYGGDAGRDGGHVFVKESAPDVHTHHLHVVAVGDPQWREWLLGTVRETILPTLEALRDLKERGVVLDGGYPSGKRSIMLIVEADSEERARKMIEGVPGWEAGTTEVSRLHTLDELSDRRNLRAG